VTHGGKIYGAQIKKMDQFFLLFDQLSGKQTELPEQERATWLLFRKDLEKWIKRKSVPINTLIDYSHRLYWTDEQYDQLCQILFEDLKLEQDSRSNNDNDDNNSKPIYNKQVLGAIQLYMRELKKCPTMSREETAECAIKYQAGKEAQKKLDAHSELNSEEKANLTQQVKIGERARTQMIEGNLALVVFLAKRYVKPGIAFEDLIQEGNMGLMRAVETYNPERGALSTYATSWICKFLRNCMMTQMHGKIITIPPRINEDYARIQDVYSKLLDLRLPQSR